MVKNLNFYFVLIHQLFGSSDSHIIDSKAANQVLTNPILSREKRFLSLDSWDLEEYLEVKENDFFIEEPVKQNKWRNKYTETIKWMHNDYYWECNYRDMSSQHWDHYVCLEHLEEAMDKGFGVIKATEFPEL